MTKYLPFVFDEELFFTNQKCFFITSKTPAYLTAFLNSSLFKYCFIDNFPKLGDRGRELSKIFFDKIPVKKVDELTESKFAEIIRDIQHKFTKGKAQRIDMNIFEVYGLSKEDQEAIGYIEIE